MKFYRVLISTVPLRYAVWCQDHARRELDRKTLPQVSGPCAICASFCAKATALSCPLHGDCTCPPAHSDEAPAPLDVHCPLHGEHSQHVQGGGR